MKVKRELVPILEYYYSHEAKNLYSMADSILSNLNVKGDKDRYYIIASEVFVNIIQSYDSGRDFKKYLYSCLNNKFKTELTAINRIKRMSDKYSVSLNSPVDVDGEASLEDYVPSKFDTESKAIGEYSENIIDFINSLSEIQKRIIFLRVDGYQDIEIQKILNVDRDRFISLTNDIKSHEREQKLTKPAKYRDGRNDEEMANVTAEVDKTVVYSIDHVTQMLNNFVLLDNHPLQRYAEQWTNVMKGNLIGSALHGFRIPEFIIAEQVRSDGVVYKWVIDGKQRLTNFRDFLLNRYKINKKIERPVIEYQTPVLDENGNFVFGKDRLPLQETRQFDLRGKFYKDLPEALQLKLNSYMLNFVIFMNCSDDDIEYHIRRYNASRPMTIAQKGITHLGEQFARITKTLSAHNFFKDKGNYGRTGNIKGAIDRVIVETAMLTFFPENWKKDQEEACAFLKDELKIADFDDIEDTLDRLNEIVSDETRVFFTAKDSFLWFTLFSKFKKLGVDDSRFEDFLIEFKNGLHCKLHNGMVYDVLCESKGTKDKNLIDSKLKLLTSLMHEYLGIELVEQASKIDVPENMKEYIEEFGEIEIINNIGFRNSTEQTRAAMQSLMFVKGMEDLSDHAIFKALADESAFSDDDKGNVIFYLSCFSDWAIEVNNNSSIFAKENWADLTLFSKYAIDKEIDDDVIQFWFREYVSNYDSFDHTCHKIGELYDDMKMKFDDYLSYLERKTSQE